MGEIVGLLRIIKRYLWLILLTTALAGVLAFYGSSLIRPSYTAKSLVRVLSANEGQLSSPFFDAAYSNQLMNTYAIIGLSEAITEELQSILALDYVPDISIAALPDTELLRITVEDADPEIAADAANILAELLVAHNQLLIAGDGPVSSDILRAELEQTAVDLDAARAELAGILDTLPQDPLEQTQAQAVTVEVARQEVQFMEELYFLVLSQYQQVRSLELVQANTVSVVNEAAVPSQPASPILALNLAVGVLLGLFGGIALASVLDLMDDRVHSSQAISRLLGVRVLANIPRLPRAARKLAINQYPEGEEFRRLRFNLLSQSQSKIFIITSAEPQAGRSLVVKNLAYSLALLNKRVVTVDCDFRKSARHHDEHNDRLGVTLLDLLSGDVPLSDLIKHIGNQRNYVLEAHAANVYVNNTAELLTSSKMSALMRLLEEHFDYVLIDTPAYISVTDAAIVSSKVPQASVLSVVRKGKTHRASLQWMSAELQQQQIDLAGVIVNFDDFRQRRAFVKYYPRESFVFNADVKSPYVPSPARAHQNGAISVDNEEDTMPYAAQFRPLDDSFFDLDDTHVEPEDREELGKLKRKLEKLRN